MAEPKPERQLNSRQAAFVREYLVDRCASQAALRAGYSAKSAGQQAHDLLKNPKVQDAIEREESALAAATKINREKMVRDLVALRNVDLRRIARFKTFPCSECHDGLDVKPEHPDGECKACRGLGYTQIVVADFDTLTQDEADMVKSVKMGKNGPEVTFHDKRAIDDRIAKLCGFEPKQAGDAANPIHVLLQAIQGTALPLAPARLPPPGENE